jgi:hypothetical protein
VAIAIALLISLRPWQRPTALDEFWAPLLDPNKAVVLCVGRIHDADGRARGVGLSDAITLARLSGLLQSKKQPWTIRTDEEATFGDLRQAPAILIGAFNDSWNLRLANSTRFTFHQKDGTYWIEDQQNHSARNWSVTRIPADAPVSKDYAVITRIIDPSSDRILLGVGGFWGFGTQAAGEFLTDPKYIDTFARKGIADWDKKKNLQIVLSTEVIRGKSGPPNVIGIYSW